MKKVIYILFVFVVFSGVATGQYAKVPVDPSLSRFIDKSIHPVHSSLITTPRAGAISSNDDSPRLNRRMISFSKEHFLPPAVQAEVDRKTSLKVANRTVFSPNEPLMPASSPRIDRSFQGNVFDGFTPPDNSIAINNRGDIVSVINSNMEYYDMQGNLLFSKSFTDIFGNDPELTGSIYDPVVIYDSQADRFFMVVLHGSNSTISKVLVCFSQSNDITDGWWYYKLSGNPLGAGNWFDYPKIGFSNNEVYVTGNLFGDNNTFSQAIIFQIQKAEGYAGQNLNWQYWSGITLTPFTIVPASFGQQGSYGPGMYFITTIDDNDNDKIGLFNLTDDLSGNPEIQAYQTTSSFALPGNALQKGSVVKLNNDDTRGLHAFYLNGIIHFVFHSDRQDGYAGINYNRLKVSDLSLSGNIFGMDGYDYSYPSLASYGNNVNDQSVMIAFDRSGSDIYPECRVVHVDNDGNWSNSTLVKEGETYVDVYASADVTRWGDYSGICRKQNATSPEVWLCGCYGYYSLNEHSFNSWIARINGLNIGVPEKSAKMEQRVFPNPVTDHFALEFTLPEDDMITITLTDMSGKVIRILYHDQVRSGRNQFSFNKGALTPGMYIITLQDSKSELSYEKINVQ